MSDSLHNTLSKFRDTMLSAVANLEFEIRDIIKPVEDKRIDSVISTLNTITKAVSNIENKLSMDDILQIQPQQNSRNIVVSRTATPALSSIVASFNPPNMSIDFHDVEVNEEKKYMEEEDVEMEEEEEEEEEEVEEEVEVEEEEEEVEVEEEEEEVEEEVEEEEEEVEVEEFEYKGNTYQRDTEGNVYLDDEVVGLWNGKKIIPL